MQRENPVLVKKLIDYQLKAKDVLAAAFLGNKKTTEDIIPVYKPQGNMIQLQDVYKRQGLVIVIGQKNTLRRL